MNNEQIHRDIGRVEGEVKALRRDVTEMKVQLSTACAYIERQKGARRATIAISSGASAVVAAIVGWGVSVFFK
jgi:hypothetical protein